MRFGIGYDIHRVVPVENEGSVMLGGVSVFKMSGASARNPDEATRQMLARALRPFILRRTKEQVVSELPEKSEQTLYCELEPEQRETARTLLGQLEDLV